MNESLFQSIIASLEVTVMNAAERAALVTNEGGRVEINTESDGIRFIAEATYDRGVITTVMAYALGDTGYFTYQEYLTGKAEFEAERYAERCDPEDGYAYAMRGLNVTEGKYLDLPF